ncbi:hypothetical protein ACR1PO_15515 [Chryseobacterium sp. RRHN12]|uniref:hypothetical protein n=1 Tax=Chryseobacterium sp. RRHN12 TaxID=3437884 RepID=UPI003D9B569D
MEFKGTKEILIDQGSVFKPLSGYVSVKLTNSEGWPVATVFAPDFEKLKADSLMLSKAPEMLEFIQSISTSENTPIAYRKIAQKLIKEATEI